MAVTALLIVLIIGGSTVVVGSVNDLEKEQSFERLQEEAGSLAKHIDSELDDEQSQLELVSSLVAHVADLAGPETPRILSACDDIGMIGRLELLLPDGTLVTAEGNRVDASESLSFADLSAEGSHVGSRETDVLDPERPIVRVWTPVVRDGETAAMLCGVIELEDMSAMLAERPYGGQAAVYLVEGSTGNFLVDTWHPGEPGNIWELGEREMAPGYDDGQLRQDMTEGRAGYVVFMSDTAGEPLYFCFEPCGVNDWQAALSVPESVILERANTIKGILNAFLAFEAVCFTLYFLWLLRHVNRETAVKQRQLDTINYLYEVEKLLFNAHEDRKSLASALEQVASITSAEGVGLWIVEDGKAVGSFLWGADGFRERGNDGDSPASPAERENIELLARMLQEGDRVLVVRSKEELDRAVPRRIPDDTRNMIALPIMDGDTVRGVIVARNMERRDFDASLLQNVEPSFVLFCRNLRAWQAVKERGEVDALTGLLNRNRFESDREHWRKLHRTSLSCVYVDANGLHELNNANGHEAGDRMLCAVARHIKRQFGGGLAYRIGGDEFVVLAPDVSGDDLSRRVKDLEAGLADEGISVSVGASRLEGAVVDADALLEQAEKSMYRAKSSYYERAENDRRAPRSERDGGIAG